MTVKNRRLNGKMKTLVFLLVVLTVGFPMWLISYSQYEKNIFIPVILCGLCAAILVYKTVHNKWKIMLFVIAAHQVAFLLKVIIDWISDPTNHNLLPFEIIILIIFDALACAIGVAIGLFLRETFLAN